MSCRVLQLLLTRWAHSTYDLDIHQIYHGAVLHVIPVPVVQPLAQQLHRGLSTIDLPGWHVHIIHKYHLMTYNISILRNNTTIKTTQFLVWVYSYNMQLQTKCFSQRTIKL